MTLAQRRLLLIGFIVFFSVFSPLLILYASGYRYNTRLHKIEQVGLLSLSVQPVDATVRINGALYPVRGNQLLSTLPPDDYRIRVEKAGYTAWEKTLALESGRTTFARDIRLFSTAEAQPLELFANPLRLLAQDGRTLLFAAPHALVAFNLDTKAILEGDLPLSDAEVEQSSFSGSIAAFKQGDAWYQATIDRNAITIVALQVPAQTQQVIVAGKNLFALTSNQVVELGETTTALFSIDEPQTIAVAGSGWYVLAAEATHKRSFLYEVTSANTKPQFVTALPYSNGWRIVDVNGTLLTMHDDTYQRLDLIDTRITPPALASFDGVFSWQWSNDRRSLLTATFNELAIYYLENGVSQELLLRQSQPLTSAIWSDDERWAYYTSAGTVYAIERDDRSGRNIIALAEKKTSPLLLGTTTTEVLFSSLESTSFVIWNKTLSD